MALGATPIPILADNYAWLLRCERTGTLAVVDPADAGPVIAAIEDVTARDGGALRMILLTHHHDDHVAGVDAVRARFGATVVGARADRHRLPRLDEAVDDGDEIRVGDVTATVIATPGHTIGHVSFFFPDGRTLVCGDTLFSLGCGRLLEGTPADMFRSLGRFASLPDDTLVACGHEYTAANARFASHVAPDDEALRRRADEVARQRAAGRPTLPSRLGDEKRLNPFMRAPDADALGRLRAAKDAFKG